MKIQLDMQGIQTDSRHRGIGRYTRATVIEFLKQADGRDDVELLFNAALDGVDDAIEDLARAGLYPQRRAFGPIRGTASYHANNEARRVAAERVYTHALDTSGADVIWMSSLVEGFADDALIPHGLPRQLTVATLYDLIPLHDPEYLGHSRARDWYMRRIDALRRCDLLLAISSWVREDAIERLGLDPDRIVAIGAGVDPMFRPSVAGANLGPLLKQRLGIALPFVLYNGGTDKRKNVEALFPAFAHLPETLRRGLQLVVVGRTDEPTRQRLEDAARTAGLDSSDVVFAGYVSDEDLVRLYQACSLFVFPSEREGFGLPPLEAMACGAPVIVNDATSLPEVVGDPTAMFDATRLSSITAAMRRVLEDPARAAALREGGLARAARFTWPEVAARARDAIEAALLRRTGQRGVELPRWTPVETKSAAQAGAGVQTPLYILDKRNVVGLLPYMREWPGFVEWNGPYPNKEEMTALDRYRAGGWRAVIASDSVDWLTVLEHESIAMRETEPGRGEDGRQDWIDTHAFHPCVRQRAVEDSLAADVAGRLQNVDLARIADALDRLRPAPTVRWLVDVTHIARADLRTGIQRVVRSILVRWLQAPPADVRIEPVMFRDGRYHHAHAYAARLLGLDVPQGLHEDTVAITGSEVFVGLDWAMESLPSSAMLLRTWRRAGVAMHFVAYDLLPLTLPDAFHAQTREAFARWLHAVIDLADGIHSISRSTEADLAHWIAAERTDRSPALTSFPLGVEARAVAHTAQLESRLADALAARPSFLMVGTIEPRKGHEQALEAMELLWASNADANLVIVGKRGWLVAELIQRLERHVERGQRLFWLEDCPDEMLDALYESTTALLVTSLGEGFGLPVIEAAQRGKPVIARSLDVFREVAGDYPTYFDGTSAAALSTCLARWLAVRPAQAVRTAWPDWDDAASALADRIADA
jgi:glycosyltransferase involved in cell wall biosynthesis